MQIDKNKLSALAYLDDQSFGQIIYNVVIAAGGSRASALGAMASAHVIKTKLKNASDDEIRQLVGYIGEKNISEILGGMNTKK